MTEPTIKDLLQELESLLKDKPDCDDLPGGSGYRNGYADGYQHALSRFKDCRDRVLKKNRK